MSRAPRYVLSFDDDQFRAVQDWGRRTHNDVADKIERLVLDAVAELRWAEDFAASVADLPTPPPYGTTRPALPTIPPETEP